MEALSPILSKETEWDQAKLEKRQPELAVFAQTARNQNVCIPGGSSSTSGTLQKVLTFIRRRGLVLGIYLTL